MIGRGLVNSVAYVKLRLYVCVKTEATEMDALRQTAKSSELDRVRNEIRMERMGLTLWVGIVRCLEERQLT